MEAMIGEFIRPYEDRIADLQRENQDLHDKIRVYESGSQYSRDDITKMENRLRDEMDQNSQLLRKVRELEMSLQTATSKVQTLENQVQRANQDMNTDARERKAKEDHIAELQKRLNAMEDQQRKQRDGMIEFISEKRQLNASNAALMKQNDEMAQVIEIQMEREREISKVLTERAQYISEIESSMASLQRRLAKYEHEIRKMGKASLVAQEPTEPSGPVAPSEDPAVQLQQYREENHQLKERIYKLEEEEQRAKTRCHRRTHR